LQLFAPASHAQFPASAKLAMPLQPHGPALFCPLSPEAYLLTERRRYFCIKEVCHSERSEGLFLERSEKSITGQVLDEIVPIVESTHPVIASLDHPLFAFGGKRGLQNNYTFSIPLFAKQRGVPREAQAG